MVTILNPDDRASQGRVAGLRIRIEEGLRWRLRALRLRAGRLLGTTDTQWARVVMDRQTAGFVDSLHPQTKSALEISGAKWRGRGFASYRSAEYPEYDVCESVLNDTYDIIIAEQVLEHVLWPYRATRNLWRMLNPGGTLVVTTPFLLRVHNYPVDCSRWTELGLKHLLVEAGFDPGRIVTGSWGNRACIRANFRRFPGWNPRFHSLKNEPEFPIVIWAFATKPPDGAHEG